MTPSRATPAVSASARPAVMYDRSFFSRQSTGSLRSARAILPHVVDLIEPASVIDIGCGVGTWLRAARELGVKATLGVDGEYVDAEDLLVAEEEFIPADLSHALPAEVLRRRFDLALCLEVGEHLSETRADRLIEELTTLAPAVLFSAAIPQQGGDGHVNEQWPSWWARRFEALGWATLDPVRRLVWDDESVEWWYAQNTLLFVGPKRMAGDEPLRRAFERTSRQQLDLVHPRRYRWLCRQAGLPVPEVGPSTGAPA